VKTYTGYCQVLLDRPRWERLNAYREQQRALTGQVVARAKAIRDLLDVALASLPTPTETVTERIKRLEARVGQLEIKRGSQDIEAGRLHDHEDVKRELA
jgi:hypothetical protein